MRPRDRRPDDDRRRLTGGVEHILQKHGRDDMLREIGSILAMVLERGRKRTAAEGTA